MTRYQKLVRSGLVAAAMLLAAGCGDDKSSNAPTEEQNEQAALFIATSLGPAQVDGMMESLEQTMQLLDVQLTSPGRPGVEGTIANVATFDTVTYTYSGGNHAFYFVAIDAETTSYEPLEIVSGVIRGWDTVTIWDGNLPQPDKDPSTDSLRAKLLVRVEFDGGGSSIDYVRRHSLKFIGNPWLGTPFVVKGTVGDSTELVLVGDSGACSLDLYTIGNIVDVAVDSSVLYFDACPESGSLEFDMGIDLACEGEAGGGIENLRITGDWTAIVTWANDMQTIHLSRDSFDYQATDSCGESGPIQAKLNLLAVGKR